MASNWRLNVWLAGINYTEVTLLAPVLTNPGWYLSNVPGPFGTHLIWFWNGAFSQLATPQFFSAHTGGGPHFPYGFTVGPD